MAGSAGSMDAVYPAPASVLDRGRRRRRSDPRHRHRTMPVTFAEIKEVDEDNEENEEVRASSATSVASVDRRRRLDLLDDRLLCREFAEFRRRRARREQFREVDEASAHESTPSPAPPQRARTSSESHPDQTDPS